MRQLLLSALYGASLLLGVITLTFLLFNVAPGDPARVMLGPNASEDAVQLLRAELGTDRPVWEQLQHHLVRLLRLDLGRSIIDGRLVSVEIINKFRTTLTLGGLALLIAFCLSYILNLFVFYLPNFSPVLALTKIGVITPTFFSGVIVALLFGIFLPIVPLTGYGSTESSWIHLMLPASVVALYPIAVMTSIFREKIQETLGRDYARSAFSLGFSRLYVFHVTLLPSVAVSLLAGWVNLLSTIFVASFIIEVIFSIPGVGPLLISAIQQKDFPVLQGIVILNACFFVLLNWMSEFLFRLIDPRIRHYAKA